MSKPVSHTRLATYREIISIGEGLGFPDDFDNQEQRAPEQRSPLQIQPMEESSSETPVLRSGDDYWMDPSGRLEKCNSHAYWGSKYVLKHGIPFDSEKAYTIYEALFDRGFIRIKIKTGQLYIEYNPARKPSSYQWRKLKHLALDNNLKLVDDSGDSEVEINLYESINHNSGILINEGIMKPEEKEEFKSLLAKLFSHLRDELKLKTLPSIHLVSDPVNAAKMLGKTGYYDSNNKKICLFITDRHPKDILRSFAHEVIHHWQHENKQLDKSKKAGESDPQYAQNDPWMRQMEKQAYLLGNILFRDWEDGKKATDKQSQMESRRLKKKVLREHPESMFGHGWLDSSCVGPFVIFHNNNDPRYIFSDRNNSTLYLDGEEVGVSGIDSHGGVLARLNKIDSSINNKSFKSVSGRIWDIEDMIYVGLWSDMKQIKKFGKSKFLASLTKLMAECLGVKIQDVIFNVYDDDEQKSSVTPTMTYKEFLSYDFGKETDLEKQAKEKELHMMDPTYKGQMMKQMGIKPKTPGEIPDFKKKQLAGIDELGSI